MGDFVAFEFEAIMKKLPQVSVMIKTETLIKEKDITQKNFEKKKEMISQKVSEAKKNNRKATYENTSYQKKAMIEKEKYNRLVEAARNKNVLEYFQESGYNIEKKGGQYYITEIAGLVINAEKNQWYSHYENIGRTNNTLDCLTKVLDIDFKQAVYDRTGKDISSIKSESNNYNYSNKPLYTTRPVVKAVASTAKAEKELVMPEQSENFRQMFAYMIKTRKIPAKIVEELVHAKLLYQSENEVTATIKGVEQTFKNANAVFIHKNEKNEIIGAEIQGLNSFKRYKGMASGTGESAFMYCPVPSSDGKYKKAYIFESAIDLMSFYTYCKKEKIEGAVFVSMAGLKPTIPMKLKKEGVEIISCVDNDDAGRRFEKENNFNRSNDVKKLLDDNGFKDWNEMLVFKTEYPNARLSDNLKSEQKPKTNNNYRSR